MRYVTSQQAPPRLECALTGRGPLTEPEGFFETGRELRLLGTDNRPFDMHCRAAVSKAAVEECARMAGWASPEEIAKARELLAAQDAEIAEIRERLEKIGQLQELEAELGAAA